MPAAGMPASSRSRTSSGRNRPLGTGRVMSHTRMQALFAPRAASASGRAPTGLRQRGAHRADRVGEQRHLGLADHA